MKVLSIKKSFLFTKKNCILEKKLMLIRKLKKELMRYYSKKKETKISHRIVNIFLKLSMKWVLKNFRNLLVWLVIFQLKVSKVNMIISKI